MGWRTRQCPSTGSDGDRLAAEAARDEPSHAGAPVALGQCARSLRRPQLLLSVVTLLQGGVLLIVSHVAMALGFYKYFGRADVWLTREPGLTYYFLVQNKALLASAATTVVCLLTLLSRLVSAN